MFEAQAARITPLPKTGGLLVVYELDLMSGDGLQVQLLADERSLRVGLDPGADAVPLEAHEDLSIPERCC